MYSYNRTEPKLLGGGQLKSRRTPTVLPFVEDLSYKALEVYCQLKSRKFERGQSTAEYVAVTAVAVTLAVTVIFLTLHSALNDAVDHISNWIEGAAPQDANQNVP
jgi:hypothetical protein